MTVGHDFNRMSNASLFEGKIKPKDFIWIIFYIEDEWLHDRCHDFTFLCFSRNFHTFCRSNWFGRRKDECNPSPQEFQFKP